MTTVAWSRFLEAWRGQPLVARDAVLAAPVAAIVVMATVTTVGPVRPDSSWSGLAFGATAIATLMWRRRFPTATWVTALLLAVSLPPLTLRAETGLIVLSFAAYSLIAHDDRSSIPVVTVVSYVAGLGGTVMLQSQVEDAGIGAIVLMPALTVFYAVGVAVLMRTNRRTAAVVAARNTELERLHGVEAREAVLAERARIARELHDIVAHHVSGIVLQAKAARSSLARRPGEVEPVDAALAEIVESGSTAMTSMRGLLGMLRDDGSVETAPQPVLDDLPELVAAMSGRGVDATLRHRGEPQDVPLDVQLSAYRIVQEALTNTARHARARRAEVVVDWEPGAIEVVVDDNGIGPTAAATAGHGLVGMAERAALVGGTFETGRSPVGGWRVRARLPFA